MTEIKESGVPATAIYPWQQKQWQSFLRAYAHNRLSHAYFLMGADGLGKADFARHLAMFLLCELPDKKDQPCGHCRGCQWMFANTHPDFLSILLEDKGHSIKIDQIRVVTQKLTQTAQRGGYQVVLISPAHSMPIGAANALLKTLEEPPGKVVLLLAGSQVHHLPATILSRCQRVIFSISHVSETVAWLQRKHKNEQNIATLLKLSGNAPLIVQQFVEMNYLDLRNQVLHHLLAMKQKTANVISPVSGWVKWSVDTVLQVLLTVCIDLSRVQYHVSLEYLMHADCAKQLIVLSENISPMALQRFIILLLEKKNWLARGLNLNAQLCLESLLIRWNALC